MPFAATGMDLKIIILSEVNQKEKDRYVRNLKCDTDKLIYKMETDSET